jgi:hypothetical protein
MWQAVRFPRMWGTLAALTVHRDSSPWTFKQPNKDEADKKMEMPSIAK